MYKSYCFILLFLSLLFTACEKPLLEEEDISSSSKKKDGGVEISFNTRSAVNGTDVGISNFSRFNVSIFDEYGVKIGSDAQQNNGKGFGTSNFIIAPGKYKLAAIAHHNEKSVAISDVKKVVFSGVMKDIFSYYGDFEVLEGVNNYSINMTRAVGRFRVILTDPLIPTEVYGYQITYKGSKSINLETGGGATYANQTDAWAVDPGARTIDFYLLPGTYTITLNAMINSSAVASYIFEEVNIVANGTDEWEGTLFNGNADFNHVGITFVVDPTWGEFEHHTF